MLLAGGGLHWQRDGEGPGKVFRQGDGESKEIQSEGKLLIVVQMILSVIQELYGCRIKLCLWTTEC